MNVMSILFLLLLLLFFLYSYIWRVTRKKKHWLKLLTIWFVTYLLLIIKFFSFFISFDCMFSLQNIVNIWFSIVTAWKCVFKILRTLNCKIYFSTIFDNLIFLYLSIFSLILPHGQLSLKFAISLCLSVCQTACLSVCANAHRNK